MLLDTDIFRFQIASNSVFKFWMLDPVKRMSFNRLKAPYQFVLTLGTSIITAKAFLNSKFDPSVIA